MADLIDYVHAHTSRGECGCGSCIDKGDKPEPGWFSPHVIDMVFFRVAMVGEPSAAEFRLLTSAHRGEFLDTDLLDGRGHHFIEVGGWIGDQGLAMRYMALGAMLDVFTLVTPYTLWPDAKPETALDAAAGGLLIVEARPEPVVTV